MTNHLLDLGQHDKVLEICQLGIDVRKRNKVSTFLGELYSNMGEAYGQKKDKEKAHHFYQLAVMEFERYDELAKAQKTRNWALEVDGITVT